MKLVLVQTTFRTVVPISGNLANVLVLLCPTVFGAVLSRDKFAHMLKATQTFSTYQVNFAVIQT